MKARHYDPVIGRFYSNDPVGVSVSDPMLFNRYAYANNNPYRYTDPTGENVSEGVGSFLSELWEGATGRGDGQYNGGSVKENFSNGYDGDWGDVAGAAAEDGFNAIGLFSGAGLVYAAGRGALKYGAYRAAAGVANKGLVDTLSARARKLIQNGELVGSNPTAIRTIGTGRLREFTAQNTSTTGGTDSAQALFRALTGKSPTGGPRDRFEIDGGLEVSFRPAGNSGHPKIEIVNQSMKTFEKITFLP